MTLKRVVAALVCAAPLLSGFAQTVEDGELTVNVKYPDGTVVKGLYKGRIVNGMRDGRGMYTYTDPKLGQYTYFGDFKNNKEHGKGVMTLGGFRYEGDYVDGMKTGRGIVTLADGTVHEGEYLNNARHGMGITRYPNGDTHEGSWLNAARHGFAVYTTAAGTVHATYYEANLELQRSANLANALRNVNDCAGKYPGWTLLFGECGKGGIRNGKDVSPWMINTETLDLHCFNMADGKGSATIYRSGIQIDGQLAAPFNFKSGYVSRLLVTEAGQRRSVLVYEGPMRGMAPHGKGKCLEQSGDREKMVACVMENGARTK